MPFRSGPGAKLLNLLLKSRDRRETPPGSRPDVIARARTEPDGSPAAIARCAMMLVNRPAVRAVATLQARRGALQPAAPVLHAVPALRTHPASIGEPGGPLSRPHRRPRLLSSHLRAGLVLKAEHWLRIPRFMAARTNEFGGSGQYQLGIPVLV